MTLIFGCARCDQPTLHEPDCPYAVFGPEVDANMSIGRPDAATAAAMKRARTAAKAREEEARAAVVASLPRMLRWAVDHPRALRIILRAAPSLRPTLTQRYSPSP